MTRATRLLLLAYLAFISLGLPDATFGIAWPSLRHGFALPPSAIEFVPPPPKFKEQPAGPLQGAAMTVGRGRVVVLGEAAMLTAQVDGGQRFGMNLTGIDNRQFALNVMHWLSRLM